MAPYSALIEGLVYGYLRSTCSSGYILMTIRALLNEPTKKPWIKYVPLKVYEFLGWRYKSYLVTAYIKKQYRNRIHHPYC